MQGIEESEKFFVEHGRKYFEEKFPHLFMRLAFGLAGHGSECFGFDDDVSRDHDFSSGFAVWITDEDDEKYGFLLERAYNNLISEHLICCSGKSSMLGETETGICKISSFYRRHIGLPRAPETWQEWMHIPEYAFAETLNGKVFHDIFGKFSAIRKEISTGMPEDVRLKKIAARLAVIAQSGQYNFQRCHLHNEPGAAAFALTEFVQNSISLIFLLNGKFAPYYKWMFRAMKTLSCGGELAAPLEFLLTDNAPYQEKQAMIEDICSQLILILSKQGLSEIRATYLEEHAFDIMKKIRNPHIRALHIME